MDLYPHQEMALDGTYDFSGISTQISSRNWCKTLLLHKHILETVLEGKEFTILCGTEKSAKQTFDGIVKFFEMVNKNG